jgi:type VI secretion system protein ImpM
LSREQENTLPGIYGKISVRGDFVVRRLARSFVEPWDSWLQEAMICSREQLGNDWLPAYLTSPIWRFVLSAGLCSEQVMAGLLMPSVDEVGRYFPLALAAPVVGCRNPAVLPITGAEWFDQTETLLLSALEDDLDLKAFDDAVRDIGGPQYGPEASATADRLTEKAELSSSGWRQPLPSVSDVASAYFEIADQAFATHCRCYSLWWTSGSEDIEASFVVSEGLPRISGFAAFLDGGWERWGWKAGADRRAADGPG